MRIQREHMRNVSLKRKAPYKTMIKHIQKSVLMAAHSLNLPGCIKVLGWPACHVYSCIPANLNTNPNRSPASNKNCEWRVKIIWNYSMLLVLLEIHLYKLTSWFHFWQARCIKFLSCHAFPVMLFHSYKDYHNKSIYSKCKTKHLGNQKNKQTNNQPNKQQIIHHKSTKCR